MSFSMVLLLYFGWTKSREALLCEPPIEKNKLLYLILISDGDLLWKKSCHFQLRLKWQTLEDNERQLIYWGRWWLNRRTWIGQKCEPIQSRETLQAVPYFLQPPVDLVRNSLTCHTLMVNYHFHRIVVEKSEFGWKSSSKYSTWRPSEWKTDLSSD